MNYFFLQVAKEQLSQKLNTGDFDSEGKDKKNGNISTMSLPNLNNHSEGTSTNGVRFFRYV